MRNQVTTIERIAITASAQLRITALWEGVVVVGAGDDDGDELVVEDTHIYLM